MLYANYIRNKMHHLVKIVFASGYPLKIISKFKKKAAGYTIHGKTEIGKNLIPYPYMYTTRTVNGVTYTDNGDGSISVSGTATGYSDFWFTITPIAPNTAFTFSKNQSDDSANIAFVLKQLDENRTLVGTETTLIPTVTTHTFTTAENTRYIQIACKRDSNNTECKGTYKPMLEIGDTATEYEPYTKYGVGDKTKNLLNIPYMSSTQINNYYAVGTYTDLQEYFPGFEYCKGKRISFSAKSSNSAFVPEIVFYFSDGSTIGLQDNSKVFPEDKTVTKIEIRGRTNSADYNGTTVTLTNIQLELGETATEYEPYGYKIPLVNTGKNLLPYPYSGFGGAKTKTINGITFTDNGGGLITLNGTATADVEFNFTGDFALPPGNFQIAINHDYQDFYLVLDEREGNPDKNGNYVVYCDLTVSKGVTINNGTCRPQIVLAGSTATEYEPYRVPDTITVYHNAQLKDGESINYKADGLPELQLYKGENNITTDTAIKPSAIDIKYLN